MDIRLIATDMDGTLLDNEKNVSDRSRRALTLAAPSLPLANYLHNKIFPDFARFSLLFFASYVIIIM